MTQGITPDPAGYAASLTDSFWTTDGNGNSIDYVVIGGDRSPGKVTVRGLKQPSGWDERKGYAMSGATLVPSGDPLANFDLFFEFWLVVHRKQWEAFYGKYFALAAKLVAGSTASVIGPSGFPVRPNPQAIGVYHPLIQFNKIASCVVTNRGELHNDETGGWSQVISLRQYRKPVMALQRPIGTIPSAIVNAPIASTKAEIEIQQKSAYVANLRGVAAPPAGAGPPNPNQ
jgi:hypothetical protein